MIKVNLLNVRHSNDYFKASRASQDRTSILFIEDDVDAERNWIRAGLDILWLSMEEGRDV